MNRTRFFNLRRQRPAVIKSSSRIDVFHHHDFSDFRHRTIPNEQNEHRHHLSRRPTPFIGALVRWLIIPSILASSCFSGDGSSARDIAITSDVAVSVEIQAQGCSGDYLLERLVPASNTDDTDAGP